MMALLPALWLCAGCGTPGIDRETAVTTIDEACDEADELQVGKTITDRNDDPGHSLLLQSNCGGNDEAERLYGFTAESDGTLRVTWTADLPMTLYALRACNPNQVLVCEPPAVKGVLTVPMKGAERVTVVVDGGGHKQRAEFTLTTDFL